MLLKREIDIGVSRAWLLIAGADLLVTDGHRAGLSYLATRECLEARRPKQLHARSCDSHEFLQTNRRRS